MTTNSFCHVFDNNRELMNFPKDTINFCQVFDRWTTSVGYPITMVFTAPGRLQFVTINSLQATIEPYMFPFHVGVAYVEGPPETRTVWLLSNMEPFEVPDTRPMKYYYSNPNASSLYRVNYDRDNWDKLFKYGQELSYGTKIAMIVDSFYFYSENNLHFEVAVSSLLLLKDDTEHVAWESVDYVLAEIDLLFRDSSLYDWFLSFLGQLVHEYYMRHRPRASVAVRFACKAGVRLCLEETWAQLQEFVTYRHLLPAREAVLCSGMRSANAQYYVFLEHLVASKDRDRNVLLMAMTCYEDRPLLERLLAKIFLRDEYSLTKQVKYRLYVHMIMATMQGGDAAWRFLVVHHKMLQRDYEGPAMDHLLETMAKCLVSRYHLRIMRKVLKSLGMQRPDILSMMKRRNRLLKVTYGYLKDILGFN